MAKFKNDDDMLSVLEEEHERRGIFAFFDIVFNKFIKFMTLNLIHILFGLPYMLLLFWLSPLYYAGNTVLDAIFRIMFALVVYMLWGCGPFTTGAALVMRNFARREHAWIWHDYIDAIKGNFKPGLILLALDVLVLYLLGTVVRFYVLYGVQLFGTTFFVVIMCVIALFTLLYTFAHFYIYQFIVTYEGTFKQHFRNSMTFAMMKWIPNLLIFVGVAGITFALFWAFQLFALVPYVLILLILMTFVVHFYSSRAIARTLNKE